MKISINYNNSLQVFDFPHGAYFVGATVIYKEKRFVALNSYDDNPFKQDEELDFDEKFKVILHYYSNPMLEEVLKEFSGFEGIRFIELKNDVFNLSITV